MIDEITEPCSPEKRSRAISRAATARAADAARANGSRPTSRSCAPRSATRSTARSSTRSIRSCARSSASASTSTSRKAATRAGRVVYASNHRSHTDYLVEPLVLDDNGIRPPIIAAGINLFGGPLGLIHRHVTGAIPIRRNTKDPAYLITLKAYVAELLRKHDLFFYPEGGRSYSGELKTPKTGLMHAALQAEHPDLVVVPTAVAYDLVLEDHVLARQRSSGRSVRSAASWPRWCATPSATGRAPSSPSASRSPSRRSIRDSRRAVLDLTHAVMQTIGRLYKVLPTAVVASAMRPSITRRELEARADADRDAARQGRQPGRRAARKPSTRRSSRSRRAASSSSNRAASASANETCCATTPARSTICSRRPPVAPTDVRRRPKALFYSAVAQRTLKRLASRYGMATPQLRPPVHRRRDRRGGDRRPQRCRRRGC